MNRGQFKLIIIMKKYKFIDLCCGIGGFRIPFQKNGYQCVFSSDIDKSCRDVYEQNFNEKVFGDLTKIDPKIIPDFDVLMAGFPCQPFSISGHHKGFEDTRGTLFFDICRIIDKKNLCNLSMFLPNAVFTCLIRYMSWRHSSPH